MRNVVLYVASVGGCVLAILGLLYVGEGLEAPMSVGGSWAIEAAGGCDQAPVAKIDAFKISQSGPRLEIQLGDGQAGLLHGELDGGRVSAESRHREGTAARVRLAGEIEKGGGQDRLRGTLEVEGCEAPIPIVATREAAKAPAAKAH